ncbi:MAG: 50S ribosomal protein L19 [Chloroflexota bacterium]
MNIASLAEVKPNPNIPDMAPGDIVKVGVKIVEGDRQRVQVFQGVVIRIRRADAGGSFTVRQVFHGIGVERTFPLNSPMVDKVEIVRHGKVRRAKLYYLRGLSGKEARRKVKRIDAVQAEVTAEIEIAGAEAAAPAAIETEAVAAEAAAPVAEAAIAEVAEAETGEKETPQGA